MLVSDARTITLWEVAEDVLARNPAITD